MKYVIYIVIGWIVWSWIKRKILPPINRAQQAQLPTEMVACAVCSLHLPRAEALEKHGKFYCSQEHKAQ